MDASLNKCLIFKIYFWGVFIFAMFTYLVKVHVFRAWLNLPLDFVKSAVCTLIDSCMMYSPQKGKLLEFLTSREKWRERERERESENNKPGFHHFRHFFSFFTPLTPSYQYQYRDHVNPLLCQHCKSCVVIEILPLWGSGCRSILKFVHLILYGLGNKSSDWLLWWGKVESLTGNV